MIRRRRIESLACKRPGPLDELILRDESDREEPNELRERLDELMERIPRIERELVMLAMEGKTQREMGEIAGLSQNGVLWRLRRAIARLRYHAHMPEVDSVRMARDLASYGVSLDDVAILIVYLDTACVSETARRLGLRRSRVRAVVDRAPKTLSHAQLADYRAAFEYVSKGGLIGRR